MEENMTFLRSLTVEQFKSLMQVNRIRVKKSDKTGNVYFTFGGEMGKVSRKGIPSNPMISEVIGKEGDQFWLLHEEGGSGETLAEF
jgi:hypothetical protein